MLQLPKKLQVGDQVAIVSLSSGTLGEDFALHQRNLGIKRLKELGLKPFFMPNALKGIKYLKHNPQARAADLKRAFLDPQIKGIFCAIGGIDTYRILPYLLEDFEFKEIVKSQPKLFTGFSDTTIDHLMFYHLGLRTFYGPNFLNDLAELDDELLPVTEQTLKHYFTNQARTEIRSSPFWYEERTDFSIKSVNTPRKKHPETHGYEVLRGRGIIQGQLLGGCLESLTDMIQPIIPALKSEPEIIEKYQVFPTLEEWQGKILFIETSEDCPDPTSYRAMLDLLAQRGIFRAVKGIMVGKPQNERFYLEYQSELLAATRNEQLPIIYNLNFGHAYPRIALPYGAKARIDLDQRQITIEEPFFG